MPTDPPMIRPPVLRKTPGGDPLYGRGIRRVSDTSQAEAVLRNGVLFSAESVVVLSAPAASLARTLDLAGVKEEYVKRVRRLVITDTAAAHQDATALRRILAEWPGTVIACRPDIGAALSVTTETLDQAFAGFAVHPVVDAYRAFKTPPYELPLDDLAAIHYAVRPDSGFFEVSAPGTLSVARDGSLIHTPGAGKGHVLSLAVGRDAAARSALLALASAAPTPPAAGRGRIGGA
jgi:hypothetical protein